MRYFIPFLITLFHFPLFAGIEVEYEVEVIDETPGFMYAFLPQRILIGIQDDYVIVRGHYTGARMADYDLHPLGDSLWYYCRGQDEAVQRSYRRATYVYYPGDPPVTIAGLPCFRAVAVVDEDSTDIYFTTAFGVDFCQVAEIRGFAMYYSTMVNGVKVVYKAVRFRPGNFPPAMFDLSKRRIIPYIPIEELPMDSRGRNFIGKPAALIAGTTLNGKKISAEYLRGKVVALNFWFINCPPCQAEMPALNSLVARYKEDEDVVFIAVGLEDARQISRFLQFRHLAYEIIPSGASIASRHRVTSYPTNVIIGRDGKIVEYVVGYVPGVETRLKAAIERALAGE